MTEINSTPFSYDEAYGFVIGYLEKLVAGETKGQAGSHYGYDFWLPCLIIDASTHTARKDPRDGYWKIDDDTYRIFQDICWDLCLSKLIRPGVKSFKGQGLEHGDGYSFTAQGHEWFGSNRTKSFAALQGDLILQKMPSYEEYYGKAFSQRAVEAFHCIKYGCYLASCTMSGAAAEAVLLAAAITKHDENAVLGEYRRASGRMKIFNMLTGQANQKTKQVFENAMNLISNWRDDSAHGEATEVSKIEAETAFLGLIHLADFTIDHWNDITA